MGEASSAANDSKVGEDIKFERWYDSMYTMLGCVRSEDVRACSISVVPEQLRNSKVEAYSPRVVSIGPLHRGTGTDLLYMEDIKWRCMLYLLHRTENADASLRKCSRDIFGLDEIVRASYNVDDIKFNNYDLSKIVLLDGCFLLELLICGSEELNTALKFRRLPSPSPGAEVGKREVVLSDLTVLENQIPLFIPIMLATLLFPHVFATMDGKTKIKMPLLSLLGYSSDSRIDYSSNSAHVLELVHSFITAENEKMNGDQQSKDLSINIDNGQIKKSKEDEMRQQNNKEDVKSHLELKLKRCATRLEAAGVTIKPLGAESKPSHVAEDNQRKGNRLVRFFGLVLSQVKMMLEKRHEQSKHVKNNPTPAEIRFDLNIRFSRGDGKLEIPPLHITKTTEAKWRNFIAWELNRSDHAKSIDLKEVGISCKFIWYAWFFQGLICSVHDIQLLRDRKVIVVHDEDWSNQDRNGKRQKMSNEDLLTFFVKITEGVDDDQIGNDSRFGQLFRDLNSYSSTVDRATETRKIIWHSYRRGQTKIWYFCRTAYKVLRRDHIPTGWKLIAVIAGILVFGLTVAKTFYPNLGRH